MQLTTNLLTILILLSPILNGQLTITRGEEFITKPREKDDQPGIVAANANGYTYFQTDRDGVILRSFDANHAPTGTGRSQPTVNGHDFTPEQFFDLGGQPYGIQSTHNPENNRWEFRVAMLSGLHLTKPRALLSYPYHDKKHIDRVFGGIFTRYNSPSQVVTNGDGEHIAFLHNDNYKRTADDPTKLRAAVFDASLQEVWSKEITLPFKGRHWEIKDAALTDDGTLYFLGLVRGEVPTGRRGKLKPGPWEPIVGIISGTTQHFVPIRMDGDDIQRVHFSLTDGGCEVVGTYINDTDRKVVGAFYARVSPDATELTASKIALGDAVLAQELPRAGHFERSSYLPATEDAPMRLLITPISAKRIGSPDGDDDETRYESTGFYLIQWRSGDATAKVTYTRTKAKPFSHDNIFSVPLVMDGRQYALYTAGKLDHMLGEITEDGEVINPREVVLPSPPRHRLFRGNYRVIDGGLFLLLGYSRQAIGSYAR